MTCCALFIVCLPHTLSDRYTPSRDPKSSILALLYLPVTDAFGYTVLKWAENISYSTSTSGLTLSASVCVRVNNTHRPPWREIKALYEFFDLSPLQSTLLVTMTADIFSIREAVIEDIPAIVECVRALADFVGEPERCHASVETITNGLGFGPDKEKRASALVGLENGKLVAIAIYCRHFNAWEKAPGILLDTLYIKAECRGKGYGKKMIARLLSDCKADGGSYIEWTCHEQNIAAQKMYAAINADRIESLRCYRLYPSKFGSLE